MSVDLTTQLGSIELQSPIIVGSCPMTTDQMQRIAMVSNGAGALVLPSIGMWEPNGNMENYVAQLKEVCESTSIPVFASMRVSVSSFNWFDLPGKFESAGAAAIEISLQHCPSTETDPRTIEDTLVDWIQKASHATRLPLFLKLTPNFTSISHLASRLKDSVQGLVMFGRSPVVDIELDSLDLRTHWGLTQAGSVVNSLVPIMRTRNEYSQMPLVACGGVGNSQDLVKALMAGANAAMVTSALYRDGASIIGMLKEGLTQFMSKHAVSTIAELQALCPTLKEFESDIDSCGSKVTCQDIADTRENSTAIRCDRYGHPVN